MRSRRSADETADRSFDVEKLCDDFEAEAPTFIRAIRKKHSHSLAFLDYPDPVRATFSTTSAVKIVNRQIEFAA